MNATTGDSGSPSNEPPSLSRRSAAKPPTSGTNPWLVFLLPLAVYMLVGSLEPAPPEPGSRPADATFFHLPYSYYPLIYALKIALTASAIAYVRPGYRQFPWRISWLAIVVGGLGVVVWIGLVNAERLITAHAPPWLRDWGQRSGYNPLTELPGRPALAYGFLAIRLFGLAAIVPLIEEFFLRGFVMRFVVANDWWAVPFGQVNRLAVVAGTLVPVLMHPTAEWLAAAVWFSGVTWLMLRTRNIWDCVAAHALTNLLLGLYVIASGDWVLM